MRPALLLPLLLKLVQRADAAGMNTHTMVRLPIRQTLDRFEHPRQLAAAPPDRVPRLTV